MNYVVTTGSDYAEALNEIITAIREKKWLKINDNGNIYFINPKMVVDIETKKNETIVIVLVNGFIKLEFENNIFAYTISGGCKQ